MTFLTGQQLAPALTRSRPTIAVAEARGDHVVLCGLVLLAADGLAMAAAVFFAAGAAAVAQHGFAVLQRPFAPAIWSDLVPAHLAVPLSAVLAYLYTRGRYSERTPFWTGTGHVVCAGLVAAATELILGGLYRAAPESWLVALALLAFTVLATTIGSLAKQGLTAAGVWVLPVLVIGDGPSAAASEQALQSDRSLGFRFVGRIAPAGWLVSDQGAPRLWPLLHRHRARQLLIALDEDPQLQTQIVECALRERVPFSVVPAPYAFPAFGYAATRIFSYDTVFLSFRERCSRRMLRHVKTASDIVVSGTALVILAPLLLALAVACRLDGGPAFFAHHRVGANGRPFRCFKFRTMVVDFDRVLREALAADPPWPRNGRQAES